MAEDEGADCPNNARLFRIAVSNCLKSIAESVSETEFLKILTVLESQPSTARKLHKVMIKELYDSMKDDLEALLEEGDLRQVFTKIAKLSEESMASSNEHAWRPPGDVATHLRSLDVHEIKEATEELEKRVNEMERENETLMRSIAESRSRILATNDGVTRILNRAPIILQQLEDTCEHLATCLKEIEND
ncbi:PREDICTED: uncharacterized protein LOC105568630 [Vollenhovia emeryi]|uniref:uncharacterized protein LOC105568630 n=1 Tax=Vollenhovia emeryi TaxID=411798 RepID=UPI0005F575C2|nr:PREDICTED: uncharacterized protein LOC105568630 [Vollenhovia emeryi]